MHSQIFENYKKQLIDLFEACYYYTENILYCYLFDFTCVGNLKYYTRHSLKWKYGLSCQGP